MWNCPKCDAIVDDSLDACHRCGKSRGLADVEAGAGADEAENVPGFAESAPAVVKVAFAPHFEPPVASGLAAWVWVLAVFACIPVLGAVPAVALAVCSIIVAFRSDRLAWDRRIGMAGLIVAVFSVVTVGLWLVMHFASGPVIAPVLKAMEVARDRPWSVVAAQLGVLVVAIVLHECAHGVAALWSGDGTAARLGRIRLNPLAHVDLFGSIILPAILLMTPGGVVFGWAKPVPVDRRQFRRPRHGLLAVTLAGVSINMMLALACASALLAIGAALRIAYPDATSDGFVMPLATVSMQGVANAGAWELVIAGLKQAIFINLVLFALNILPIPPLDGYGVLESVAPAGLAPLIAGLRPIGSILLIVLIVTGMIGYLLFPAVIVAFGLSFTAGILTGWG